MCVLEEKEISAFLAEESRVATTKKEKGSSDTEKIVGRRGRKHRYECMYMMQHLRTGSHIIS